jgi:uncharacterized protein
MAKKKTAKKKTAARAGGKKKTAKKAAARKTPASRVATRKKTASRKKSERAKPQATATPPPPKTGSFVWHELMTSDVGRSRDFYSRLFGWSMQEEEMMPGFLYTVISNREDMHGGMMALTPEHGETPPHWMVYISVEDVDATAEQTEDLGGEILVPPNDIPVGRWALLRDPTGASFAIYKSHSM